MLRVLYWKELLEVLRDRRTLAMMVLVPVILYPALMLAMGALIAASKHKLSEVELTIARVGADAVELLPESAAPVRTTFVVRGREEAKAELRDKTLAAFVEASPGAVSKVGEGQQADITVSFTQHYDHSLEAKRRLEETLDTLSEKTLAARLEARALPLDFATPFRTESVDIDFQEALGPLLASRLLPLLLVLMLFLGAFYAAIDVTAGEKERGTLETLLVAPVPALQVMLGKYFAVSTLCLGVALANVLSLTVTFGLGITLDTSVRASVALQPAQVGLLVSALIPAAFLVSGVSMAVASLARSFKEGQDFLTPLMLVGLVPGIAAVLPGAELTPWAAFVPLYNVALLIKGVVLGTAGVMDAVRVFASTAVFAVGALWLAGKAFSSERVRFG